MPSSAGAGGDSKEAEAATAVSWSTVLRSVEADRVRLTVLTVLPHGSDSSDTQAAHVFDPYISALDNATAAGRRPDSRLPLLPLGSHEDGRINILVIDAHTGQLLPHSLAVEPYVSRASRTILAKRYRLMAHKVRTGKAVPSSGPQLSEGVPCQAQDAAANAANINNDLNDHQ